MLEFQDKDRGSDAARGCDRKGGLDLWLLMQGPASGHMLQWLAWWYAVVMTVGILF